MKIISNIGIATFLFVTGLCFSLPLDTEAVFKGHALKKDYNIAVTAPASCLQGNFKKVIQRIEAEGYKVRFEASTSKKYGSYAGSENERAEELNKLFGDDTVDAIICLNGGYGSAQVLDKLDYTTISLNPKMLIGYGDITSLHNAIYKKAHVVTISGPMISSLRKASEYDWKQFFDGVKNTEAIGKLSMPDETKMQTLVPGVAKGPIVGGKLSNFVSLIGTPYMPETKGAILVLEDEGLHSHDIDRMLNHLLKSGILKDVSGIVFGEFTNCTSAKGDFTTDEVVAKYAKLAGKPCAMGLPMGSGKNNAFLPIGVQASLEANKLGSTLNILESHNRTINSKSLQKMTYSEIGDLAASAKDSLWKQAAKEGIEPKLYLHWTAGSYNRAYPSYHINILKNGTIVSLGDLSVAGHHTWKRNTGSIGLSLTCAKGSGRKSLGEQPPTVAQIESLAKVIAVLTEKLDIPIDKKHVMTHGEAANNEDGYTKAHKPYAWWNDSYRDHDTRGDLEYLGTPESPKYNPWATDGTRGGDVIRRKALAYRNAKEETPVKKKRK